jgi:hypothetical protein
MANSMMPTGVLCQEKVQRHTFHLINSSFKGKVVMDVNSWKRCILDVVHEIADKSYQEQAWFGIGDQISSPEEVYCELFDDYIYDDFLMSSDIDMTDQQRMLGFQLKKIMDEYADSVDYLSDPKRVYDDPKWNDVREAARRLLNSF